MKIVILDGYTENPGDLSWESFEALGDVIVYDRTEKEKIAERIGDAEAVIVNKTPITKETLDCCPGVAYIGVLATGYNVVDTDAARERGIPVTNIPTYGTAAVSQFVFALLLEICHHVGEHSNCVRHGEWAKNPDWCFWKYPLMELEGRTMGIIGLGRIGRRVAQIALSLGMHVLACDTQIENAGANSGIQLAGLDQLLAQSDVVSLHCPLFETTRGLINKDNIAKMKKGAILINTSRGPLVEEADLAEALNCGYLMAAAVDVVSEEPIREDNPLLRAKNCLITPHIAWAPKESRARLMGIAADNLKAFKEGNIKNAVNME